MNRRKFVYLGWQGFDNFGDDLLHETWKAALNDKLDIEAPLFLKDYAKRATRFLRHKTTLAGSQTLVLLGGGTTVGFGNWASHARTAVKFYSADGVAVAGAGAAAAKDSYALALQEANWKRWRRVPGVMLFGVRGPLTQIECERNWRPPCAVIGDPALMYPTAIGWPRSRKAKSSLLGICLGSQTSTRFDIPAVAQAVRLAAKRAGLVDVAVFQLARSDAEVAERLSEELGGVPIVRYAGDVRDMMERISECSVFVSERLHGAVAAVSLDVPTVPLSYASKCDDFWMSVTGSKPVIGIDHSVEALASEIVESLDLSRLSVISRNRDVLVERLLLAASALGRWKAGELSVEGLRSIAFAVNGHGSIQDHKVSVGREVAQSNLKAPSSVAISVVIPFGSGIGQLSSQIRSLTEQDFDGNYEIILACNSAAISADALVDVAIPENVTLRIVDATQRRGPSFARNVGWREATSSKIAFCDADDEVHSGWVSAMSDALEAADMVGGLLKYGKLNSPEHAAWHNKNGAGLPIKFRHLPFVPSCNFGARREVLDYLLGFDEELEFGEDIDLCWRGQYAGFTLTFAPGAIVEYRLRTDLTHVWKQSFNYGTSDAVLLKRHYPYGARRPLPDSLVEALSVPGAGISMLFRPWLVRKFVNRAGNFAGRISGSIRERFAAL